MLVKLPTAGGECEMLVVDESRSRASNQVPELGALLCYGAPAAARVAGVTADYFLDEQVKRLSSTADVLAAVLVPSGVGNSDGNFSPLRWRQDLANAVEYLCSEVGVPEVCLVGYELASIQVLSLATDLERVVGVVTISTIASLPPYGLTNESLGEQLKSLGVSLPTAAGALDAWTGEFAVLDPARSAPRLGRKPWLVIHGQDDEAMPEAQVRQLLEEVAGIGELHMVTAGGESLRADPRVLALLAGWLDRIRG